MARNTPTTVTPGRYTVYYGPVINPYSSTYFDALPNCVVVVDGKGNIAHLIEKLDVTSLELQKVLLTQIGLLDGTFTLVILEPGEFIMPGFVDTHIHACQFPNLGLYVSCGD